MRKPQSFVMFLQRRYRVYYCSQAGCWYVAYTDVERRRFSLGVKTRPEAEAAVRSIDTPPDVTVVMKAERLSWARAQTLFLSHKEALGKAPGTVARYKSSLEAFGRYLRTLKLQNVDEVSVVVLEGYRAYRTGKKEECDVKTAYNDQLVIKGLFKWAAKPSRGFINVNPALDWETPEPVKPKRFCYTAEHVKALEVGVRDWLRPVVTVLAWSGLRIGELVNLLWKDVDFENRIIHLRIRDDWRPKGKSDRAIPMHPKVESVLRSRPVGEFVFLGPKGGRIKETYALQCLKADQEALKLPVADLHGFRRFFATTMMRAGVDAETVRQWGGWKTLDTMLRYLADVSEKDSVKAMDEAVKKLAAS